MDGAFGRVLARPELSRRDREISTAAVLPPMAAIAERIPGALYEELPGTPHMQTLERPELVAQALDRYLPTSMPDRMEHR